MSKIIELWFDFASPYSHISVCSVEERMQGTDLKIVWKPFILGAIFRQYGWTNSPFILQPAKGAYMWIDIERECKRYSVQYNKPSKFPNNSLTAARVAIGADGEIWQTALIKEIFLDNFYYDRDIADITTLGNALERAGCPDIETALNKTNDQAIKDKLKEQTLSAIDRGIFGAPTFFVANEMFFGNDRLDSAIAHAG